MSGRESQLLTYPIPLNYPACNHIIPSKHSRGLRHYPLLNQPPDQRAAYYSAIYFYGINYINFKAPILSHLLEEFQASFSSKAKGEIVAYKQFFYRQRLAQNLFYKLFLGQPGKVSRESDTNNRLDT